MRTRILLLMVIFSFAAIELHTPSGSALAQSSDSAALTGMISSSEEGAMEGVLVSAKKAGSTVTITVLSDAQGRYSFPRTKLEPGRFSLRIRAVRYELEGSEPVEVTAQKTTQFDLKLRRAKDLAYQLSNGEWFLSMPGTGEQKRFLLQGLGCVGCHTLERIVRSRYNATEFLQILQRMRTYTPGSSPLRPQKRPGQLGELSGGQQKRMAEQAEYLSTINLSKASTWLYPLQTLPRPKGRATRVIITEYDLPRPDSMPHDAVVDSEGMVWYSDFGHLFLGRLDPKTARILEYPVPELRPGYPAGSLEVELDREENVWLGLMEQAAIAKFDRKTQKFQTWSFLKSVDSELPQVAFVVPRNHDVDGKVWTNIIGLHSVYRLSLQSGQIESINPYRNLRVENSRSHSVYGVDSDSKNNAYFMDIGGEYIGRVDAKTLKATLYPTPTLYSAPRRGHVDSQDRLWFAEYLGNKIGMFDTTTERGIQEWGIPTSWTNPYDAVLDRNGDVWSGGMMNDRVVRLNTKTGEFTEYLLPRSTNIRRVDVDNSTNPVTFWVGNNHGASIIKLEPLE